MIGEDGDGAEGDGHIPSEDVWRWIGRAGVYGVDGRMGWRRR